MHLDLATILILHPLSLTVGALCFLYLRYRSRRSRGLGTMAVSFLVLAVAALAAGAGEQGVIDYATWTFGTTVAAPLAYALLFVGLTHLMTERRAGRVWWVMAIPACITLIAVFTQFPMVKLCRSIVFLTAMGGFSAASAVLALWDPQKERLESRYGLAITFAFKALLAFATLGGVFNPEIVRLTPAATFLILILCQFVIAMFVLILVQERAERRLIELTETDSLTRIHNRHWMMDRLPRRAPPGSASVVIDIDHFKRVNDVHGHAAGDMVLTMVAQAMAGRLGEDAIFARVGGEEFGLFLPKTSEIEAIAIAEMLRQTVEALSIVHDGIKIPVTLSAGIAVAREDMSTKRLAGRADEALYVAKRAGRNRVRLHEEDAMIASAPKGASSAVPVGA